LSGPPPGVTPSAQPLQAAPHTQQQRGGAGSGGGGGSAGQQGKAPTFPGQFASKPSGHITPQTVGPGRVVALMVNDGSIWDDTVVW